MTTTAKHATPKLPGESEDDYLARAKQTALDKLLAQSGVVLIGGVPHLCLGEPPQQREEDY